MKEGSLDRGAGGVLNHVVTREEGETLQAEAFKSQHSSPPAPQGPHLGAVLHFHLRHQRVLQAAPESVSSLSQNRIR